MLMMYMSLIDAPEEQDRFEELYYKYRMLMHRCAKEILRDDDLAEDAVHEAFLKIIRHLDKINDIECNKTKHFIVIVVENAAKDIYRKRRRSVEISWDEIEMNYSFYGKEENSRLSEIEEAIQKLPLTYRQIFIMKYSWGYSNKEIADILAMKEGTLRQRISRGKELLLETLQQMEVYVGGKETDNR